MKRLAQVQHLLQSLRTVRRRTYILTGLALAALPVTAALARDQEPSSGPNSIIKVTKTGDTGELGPQMSQEIKAEASFTSENDNDSGNSNNNPSSTNETTVTVNGKDIPADANGSVNKTVVTPGTTTNISVNNTTVGGTSNGTSSNVKIKSRSTSKVNQGGVGEVDMFDADIFD